MCVCVCVCVCVSAVSYTSLAWRSARSLHPRLSLSNTAVLGSGIRAQKHVLASFFLRLCPPLSQYNMHLIKKVTDHDTHMCTRTAYTAPSAGIDQQQPPGCRRRTIIRRQDSYRYHHNLSFAQRRFSIALLRVMDCVLLDPHSRYLDVCTII